MICRTYDVPGSTIEQNNQVSGHLAEKPDGVHFHVAVKTEDGVRVIEVWDSAEHDQRFMAESGLAVAMQEAGIPEPTVTDYEVRNLTWID